MKPIRIEGSAILPTRELERGDADARLDYTYQGVLRSLGKCAAEANCVTFEQHADEDHAYGPMTKVVARVYVISNDDAATIEAAEKKRLRALVDEIIDEGLRQVDNWGSYFHRSDIEKYQVALLLRAAVESKLGRR